MLETAQFGTLLSKLGFDFFSSVPCSFLKPLINYVSQHRDHIASHNEGDAVAHCAGAYLGGRKPVFLCQNSGLSNAASPILSLNIPYQIPLLILTSLRGDPNEQDEAHHVYMGEITQRFTTLLNAKTIVLETEFSKAQIQLKEAAAAIAQRQLVCFIVRKNTFSPYASQTKVHLALSRQAVLTDLAEQCDINTYVICTTGYISRALHELNDKVEHFYMMGSMGCASAIGLGLAYTRRDKKILVIDGDGALLMRLGNLATIGALKPANLCHVILDNGMHESTGGQSTVSPHLDWTQLARGAGYPWARSVHSNEELQLALSSWQLEGGLRFIHVPIEPCDVALPRIKYAPDEIAARFREAVCSTSR